MNQQLQLLNGSIPEEVQALIDKGEIKEDFNYDAPFKFIMRVDGKLVGIIAYMLDNVGGVTLPRFIHVIISPEFRGTPIPRMFLKDTELELKRLGYTQTFAQIYNTRKYMQRSAIHHGYKMYHQTPDFKLYYKEI